MQTVAETPLFSKQAAELFTEEERKELIDFLATNPLARFGLARRVRANVAARG